MTAALATAARGILRGSAQSIAAVAAKAHLIARRAALTGAYPDYAAAMRAAPRRRLAGYGHDAVAPVSVEFMRRLAEWDYPVLFWLERLLAEAAGRRLALLDAGGHMAVKYLAFGERIDVSRFDWAVYDLPPIVRAGRAFALREGFADRVRFHDDLADAPAVDVLLCSGLLQYLDKPFPEFLSGLARRPRTIVLNKVALRDGPGVVTLERIGPAYVPYQIRGRASFEAQLRALRYDVVDSWTIAALSRRIASHPELGASHSRGYVLRRNDAGCGK